MPANTVSLLLDLDVPVTFVEELLKQHLQTLFAATNGHTNGHAPAPKEEASAPVLPSSTGAP